MSQTLDIKISTLPDWADCSLRASLRLKGIFTAPYAGKRIAQIVGDEVHRATGFQDGAAQAARDLASDDVDDIADEELRYYTDADLKQRYAGEQIAFDRATPDWSAAEEQVQNITFNLARLGYGYAKKLSLPMSSASEKRAVFDTGRGLLFIGDADTVLFEEEANILHVVEIKTSLRTPKGWQHQLGAYALALRGEFPNAKIKGLLAYANRGSCLVREKRLSEGQMDELMAAAENTVDIIATHGEYPNPLSSRCSYCDYNGTAYCPITQSSEENDV